MAVTTEADAHGGAQGGPAPGPRSGSRPAGSLLSDELLRQLMAVGQVDVVVGLPTFNNAATVGRVVRAAHVGLSQTFPRSRTLLINSDGGSEDGTPDAVRGATLDESETLLAHHALRTVHRISAPYHGVPGKRLALRTLLTAADLLQAKAVAILDPDVVSVKPDWIAALLQPILREQYDFAAPVYARRGLEAPLVTQLVRPLFNAAFALRVQEPASPEFACSGRFVARSLRQDYWDADAARDTIDLWLLASALASDLQVCQAHLGSRTVGGQHARPSLPELFHQLVGGLFACLEAHAPYWTQRKEIADVATLGKPHPPAGDPPAFDPQPPAAAFADGVRDLQPVLATFLSSETLAGVVRCAETGGVCLFPDPLWAATLCEFAAAYHGAPMRREHLVQALVPLYLGRLATIASLPANDEAAVQQQLEALGQELERSRPYLVDRWGAAGGR